MQTEKLCRKCKRPIDAAWLYCPHCGADQQPKRAKRTRANGMGCAIKRGRTWTAIVRIRITDSGRLATRTKGGFRTKTEALEYIPVLKGAPLKKPLTLADYYATWSGKGREKLSDTKQDAYDIAWKKLDSIARTPIGDLSIAHLQAVVDEKAPTYYPAKDMRTLLSHLYKLAMADEAVRLNLAQLIELPKLIEAEPDPFSEGEIRSLWQHYDAGDGFVGYILLMIYTGMMPGELLKCRKDMIDWEKSIIVGGGLKTQKRKEIPIVFPEIIAPVLRALCASSAGDKLIHINKDNFYKQYYAALERSGCRPLKPYSCRHTTATALALGNDVAPSVIQKVMRHARFTTTQRYIHVQTDDMRDAVNTLPKYVNSAVNSSREGEGSGEILTESIPRKNDRKTRKNPENTMFSGFGGEGGI